MTRVGVCLSGCGVFDGSEIYESVLTLLALDRAGASIVCMAPDIAQLHVINHRTGEATGETRNVLDEAARICRGEITDLAEVSASDLDALIFPGGFGAAKNLCDFAVAGGEARAQPEVERLVREVLAARKPIGAICIAPAMIAAALADSDVRPTLTIGTDEETARGLEALNATHLSCPVDEFRVDELHRIVTTPAFMLAGGVAEAAVGIERLVGEVLRLAAAAAAELGAGA